MILKSVENKNFHFLFVLKAKLTQGIIHNFLAFFDKI